MPLVRTSLPGKHGPSGTASRGRKVHRVPGRRCTDTSRKIPVRPPQRCHQAVRATSTVGLASGPPGGRRAASTLDRATRTVCHMGHTLRQSSRREYPGSDVGQTRRTSCAACASSPEGTGPGRGVRTAPDAVAAGRRLTGGPSALTQGLRARLRPARAPRGLPGGQHGQQPPEGDLGASRLKVVLLPRPPVKPAHDPPRRFGHLPAESSPPARPSPLP